MNRFDFSVTMPKTLTLFGLCLCASACGTARLDANFSDTLTEVGACQGFVYAGSKDQKNLLVFKDQGGAATADTTREYDFSADPSGALLYVEVGTKLVDGFCAAGSVDGETVEARYQATVGTGILTFGSAASPGPGFDASLTLKTITFQKELVGEDPHAVQVDSFSITGFVLQ